MPSIAGSVLTSQRTSFSMSLVIYPGRNITALLPDTSTIVDSIPMSGLPPSIIISIVPSRSSITCFACVGLGLPDKLALGAAI